MNSQTLAVLNRQKRSHHTLEVIDASVDDISTLIQTARALCPTATITCHQSEVSETLESARRNILLAESLEEVEEWFARGARAANAKAGIAGMIGVAEASYDKAFLFFDDTHQDRDDGVSWHDNLKSRELLQQDPVVKAACILEHPFLWSDVTSRLTPKAPTRRIFNDATKWGLYEGIVVPVPVFGPGRGVASFHGPKDLRTSLSDFEFAALIDMAWAAMTAACKFTRIETDALKPEVSERQTIILSYLQQGNTTDEIAAQLGVKRDSIQKQINFLLKVFDVKNRSELLAYLQQHRWVY